MEKILLDIALKYSFPHSVEIVSSTQNVQRFIRQNEALMARFRNVDNYQKKSTIKEKNC